MSNEQRNTRLSFFLEKVEDVWASKAFYMCIVLGAVTGSLHYFGFIVNIRTSTANIITFASIVIGVTGVFLTLLITLQESPVFERLRTIFPMFQTKLYTSLRTQINYSLVVVILSIAINSMPPAPYKWLASIGVGVWFTYFWAMSLGAFYSVKLITDIIVKNFNIPTRRRSE